MPAIAVADALRAEGAEVSFLGTRERAEADLVPAAGYEIDYLRVSGLDRRNPLKAARAAWRAGAGGGRRPAGARAAPSRRRAGRRRLRGRPGRAGGGQDGPAAGAHRGGQPSGPRQPAAGAPRPAHLPRLPDPGSRRRPLRGDGAAGAARRARGGSNGRPPPLRDPGAGGLRDRCRRQPRGPFDQPGGVRRLHPARARGRTTTSDSRGSSTSRAVATTRSCGAAGRRRAGRSDTPCSNTSRTSGTSSPLRTWWSRGRAVR